jgi:hypothetical protein
LRAKQKSQREDHTCWRKRTHRDWKSHYSTIRGVRV